MRSIPLAEIEPLLDGHIDSRHRPCALQPLRLLAGVVRGQ